MQSEKEPVEIHFVLQVTLKLRLILRKPDSIAQFKKVEDLFHFLVWYSLHG